MVDVKIEPPESEDARACLQNYYDEIGRRFDTGFDPDAVKNFNPSEMMPPKGWFVVARIDGRPVGCGALKRLEPRMGEIKRVWTSAGSRGQGVASSIMDTLEQVAVDEGLLTLRLDTNKSLTEARRFYMRRGYREIDRYNDNHYADYWFEKTLT